MRVGILTQWYDPEPGPAALPGTLARGLAARGHDVTVLTGFPNYPTGRVADGYSLSWRAQEDRDGIRVYRTWLYPSHDASPARRMLNYLSFGASSLVGGAGALRDVDVLWVNYSPITVAPAMWWLHHRQDVPIVLHVLDLWPDTITAGGFGTGSIARLVDSAAGAWCGRMYASAASIAVNSPGVAEALGRRGVPPEKVTYVPLWADEGLWPAGLGPSPHQRSIQGVDISPDEVVLLYAGTLGHAQGLGTLLDACAMSDDPRLRCVIAGSGAEEGALRDRAVALGLRNVDFLGRVEPNKMPELMTAADASFVALSPDPLSQMTMPSKFHASLAAGRCVVVSADGDLAAAARGSGAAFVAPSADPVALAAVLRSLCDSGRDHLARLGQVARQTYESEYAASLGIAQLDRLLAAAWDGEVRAGSGLRVRELQKRDLRKAAVLHRRAFPTFFLSGLGERFLREFYRGFLRDPAAVTAVVTDSEGSLLGVVVGTTSPSGFFRRLVARQFLGFATASVLAILRRPSNAARLFRGLFYRGESTGVGALLSSICVEPSAQGRGVGATLLDSWEIGARAKAAVAAHLTTDADSNADVNRFYQAHGWVLAGEHTTREGRLMNLYQRDLTVHDG